jgi:hypothetical protein
VSVSGRLLGLLVVVSGLAALAIRLLIGGVSGGQPLLVAGGSVSGVLALLGTAVLVRSVVIVTQRMRR